MSSEDSVRPSYADEHIEVLSPIESIRRRPAMYIGGVDQRGIEQMCRSLLSVFFSQHLAGNVSKLRLSLSQNTAELWCYGSGLSFDKVIHSFEEYQIDQRHWKDKWNWYSRGILAGCDFVACNALSSSLQSQCISGGVITQRAYRQGVRCEDGHEQKKMIDEGLWLRFELDEEIFGEAILVVDDLKCWLNEQLRLLPTLTVEFEDRDSGVSEGLTVPEGMYEFLIGLVNYHGQEAMAYPEIIRLHQFHGDFRIDLAFTHCNTIIGPSLNNYVNGERCSEGGVHVDGLWDGLVHALTKFAKQERLQGNIGKRSVRKGIVAAISIVIQQAPDFESVSPTGEKAKLLDAEFRDTGKTIKTLVSEFVSSKLQEYLRYEPELGRTILSHVMARK